VSADHRPPRRCYKCGRQIGPDATICDDCNRAGMATPSATQYHGTIVVAIVVGVVIMALAAGFAIRGVGPFRGEVARWGADPPDGVLVRIEVTNEGSQAGRAKCQLTARDATDGVLRVRATLSPRIPGGEVVSYDERIPGLPVAPANVTVSCG
jgi:hypothetical protein